MDEPFELPVTYKGQQLLLPAQLVQTGYTHKFGVQVNGTEFFFEPDEEGNYRALLSPDSTDSHTDAAFLQVIAEAIAAVLK